jgi:proteasome accessory factor B
VAKVDRLLNIVAALQASSVALTAEELRERVPGYEDQTDETFRRTFERDKDDLRSVGVPVETVVIEHGESARSGYRIRRDRYELPDPGLTPEELAALHGAATAVRLDGLDDDGFGDAINKLGGTTERAAGRRVGQVRVPEVLPDLFAAVLERRPVTFRRGDDVRHLEPHRLQYERGHWYVSGHDTDRDAIRSFRLDRVQGPVAIDESTTFERPDDLPGVRLRPWEFGDGRPIRAVVLLDAVAARAVLAEDPALEVAAVRDDGGVEVALSVSDRAGLRSFVLSFLDRAELLSPPDERDALVAWLRAVADAGRPAAEEAS